MSIFTLSVAIVLMTGSIYLLKKVDDAVRRSSQKAYIKGALREQTRYALSTPPTDFGQRVRLAHSVEPVAYLEDHRLGA